MMGGKKSQQGCKQEDRQTRPVATNHLEKKQRTGTPCTTNRRKGKDTMLPTKHQTSTIRMTSTMMLTK